MIRNILTLAGILSVLVVGALAQTQQQVAFIGTGFTQAWGQQPQFAAHANWVSYGSAPQNNYETVVVAAQLQTIIASGKKPIIHLMVSTDTYSISPGYSHSAIFAEWAQGFEEIVTTAQQAKLKIIVGTTPGQAGLPPGLIAYADVTDSNKWILTYCAAHNIPVVNYDFAVTSGTGFAASDSSEGIPGYPSSTPIAPAAPVYVGPNGFCCTSQAYDLITDMAQTAIIQVEGYKLKGGYLNTVVFDGNNVSDFHDDPAVNANNVYDGGIVQFTPYGQYTDGSTHIINNADINGHIGTFTNSNSAALFLDQNGVGTGLRPGTTSVRFTTHGGVTINSWGMNTVIADDQGCFISCPVY